MNMDLSDRTVEIKKPCVRCTRHHTVVIKAQAFVDWQDGALIQDVCPELSPEEREFLISTLCPTCQKEFFDDNE